MSNLSTLNTIQSTLAHTPIGALQTRTPVLSPEPTSTIKKKKGCSTVAASVRQSKSTLEDMPQEEKEAMFKWILRELEEHQLISSRLVHQMILSKSDFDVQKREAFVIRDTVSTRKKHTAEKFLSTCRQRLRDKVDEANIQIELTCGYTKGDEFEGFPAHLQFKNGTFDEDLSPVAIHRSNGAGQLMVITFGRLGQTMHDYKGPGSPFQGSTLTRFITVLLQDHDQKEPAEPPQYRDEQYLVKLGLESDFVELYQLQVLPRQIVVTKDALIYYLGNPLEQGLLHTHIDYLQKKSPQIVDELKNFKLIRANIDQDQRQVLIAFLKHIETSFAEVLATAISWRFDFTEVTSYNIKVDARRSYAFEASLVTVGMGNTGLIELIQQVERLCFGWLSFKVNWTVIKQHQLHPKPIDRYECSNCKQSLLEASQFYVCPECAILFCHNCAWKRVDYYIEYHNQYQREALIHNQHSLIRLQQKECPMINFYGMRTSLNAIWDEGKRAIREGDFKEDSSVVEIVHACDWCERNTEDYRFVCLHCRALNLCEECADSKRQTREHQSDHILIRITQEVEHLNEDDVSLNGSKLKKPEQQ